MSRLRFPPYPYYQLAVGRRQVTALLWVYASSLGAHPQGRDPTETEPDQPLSVSCEGTGQQWPASGAGALGAADLGIA